MVVQGVLFWAFPLVPPYRMTSFAAPRQVSFSVVFPSPIWNSACGPRIVLADSRAVARQHSSRLTTRFSNPDSLSVEGLLEVYRGHRYAHVRSLLFPFGELKGSCAEPLRAATLNRVHDARNVRHINIPQFYSPCPPTRSARAACSNLKGAYYRFPSVYSCLISSSGASESVRFSGTPGLGFFPQVLEL